MLEPVQNDCRNASADQGSAKERGHIEEPSEALSSADVSHDGVGYDGADDARADYLAEDCRPDLAFRDLIKNAGERCSEHSARKCEGRYSHCAHPYDSYGDCHDERVNGSQKNGCRDVDEVRHGAHAFDTENG